MCSPECPTAFRYSTSVADGFMPCALTFFRDLTLFEEALEERVCVRNGPSGIFRDSHIVAFPTKVRCGQEYAGVDAPACSVINFIRDTSVSKRNQVSLGAVPVKPAWRRSQNMSRGATDSSVATGRSACPGECRGCMEGVPGWRSRFPVSAHRCECSK
jgi:hypothetical protein